MVVQAIQEAAFMGPTSAIEAYCCNLHVMDLVQDGLHVTCMTDEDWQQAQLADPMLDPVIAKMQDGTFSQ